MDVGFPVMSQCGPLISIQRVERFVAVPRTAFASSDPAFEESVRDSWLRA
jgi:hypothetical protein